MSSKYRFPHWGIIPPYVLKAIVQNGTEEQQQIAQNALRLDAEFRAQRAAIQKTVEKGDGRPCNPQNLRRTIYDALGRARIPGKRARKEDQMMTGDPAVDEVYDGLGVVYDFLCAVYQRDSLDGKGTSLEATVHYGRHYPNAFWSEGGKQAVFGDGDGHFFNRSTAALEVIGHEVAHSIVWHEAGLIYQSQPGALSESIADVLGSLTKQYHLNQTAEQADWLIGAGLFTRQVKGVALRSMKEPGSAFDDPILGKDPQPAHMKDYGRLPIDLDHDFGGVHLYCGIPNKAFHTAAMNLGGYAWEKAGRIWYNTLCDKRLKPGFGFARFASLTLENAKSLYGKRSREARMVKGAWKTVGIKLP